jgi:hypothetical protein
MVFMNEKARVVTHKHPILSHQEYGTETDSLQVVK